MEGGANSTYSSQYGGVVQSSAPLMEGLQSVLKQRDGEVQQLQWEIHRLQTERNFLSNEMSSLTAELEKVKVTQINYTNDVTKNLANLANKYVIYKLPQPQFHSRPPSR